MNLLSVDGNFISSLALCYVHVTTDLLPTSSIALTESPALRNFLYIASVGGDKLLLKSKVCQKMIYMRSFKLQSSSQHYEMKSSYHRSRFLGLEPGASPCVLRYGQRLQRVRAGV